jgi:hypothetical protein
MLLLSSSAAFLPAAISCALDINNPCMRPARPPTQPRRDRALAPVVNRALQGVQVRLLRRDDLVRNALRLAPRVRLGRLVVTAAACWTLCIKELVVIQKGGLFHTTVRTASCAMCCISVTAAIAVMAAATTWGILVSTAEKVAVRHPTNGSFFAVPPLAPAAAAFAAAAFADNAADGFSSGSAITARTASCAMCCISVTAAIAVMAAATTWGILVPTAEKVAVRHPTNGSFFAVPPLAPATAAFAAAAFEDNAADGSSSASTITTTTAPVGRPHLRLPHAVPRQCEVFAVITGARQRYKQRWHQVLAAFPQPVALVIAGGHFHSATVRKPLRAGAK